MARKEKEQKLEIAVTLDDEIYRINMFFNRFRVKPLEDHLLLDFGLMDGRALRQQYTVVLTRDAIKQSRESVLNYLGDVGEIPDVKAPDWQPVADIDFGFVECSNMLHMARSGDIAEIRFGIFSTGAALNLGKTGKNVVRANPLALLKCSLALQKLLLFSIYGESND